MLVRPSPLPQLRAEADLRAAIHREDAVWDCIQNW